MEGHSPWLPWWEGSKESLSLRSLIRQILFVALQGFAARSCARFGPDLRVSWPRLISAPAQSSVVKSEVFLWINNPRRRQEAGRKVQRSIFILAEG